MEIPRTVPYTLDRRSAGRSQEPTVYAVQEALGQLGYALDRDGILGPAAPRALMGSRPDPGLSPDGAINDALLMVLRCALESTLEQGESGPVAGPADGTSAGSRSVAEAVPSPSIPGPSSI